MSIVIKAPSAECDLEEIWSYIAQDNPDQATALLRRIDEKCQLLADKPAIGKSRHEFAPNLRSFVVGNYLIFYRPMAGGIEVARVLHGARDIERLFEEG